MKRLAASFFFILLPLGWPGFANEISPAHLEFFEKKIRPVLIEHCYACHSHDSKVKGGLILDSQSGLLAGGDSGAAITPGKPDQSLLVEAIRYHNRDLQMPPKNRLTDSQIAAVEKWIELGAPDPRTEATTESPTTTGGMSIAEGKQFWSFRPIQAPPIPSGYSSEHPIDAFIQSEQKQYNLSSAPATDKRTLLRRLSYNLTGLPPTLQEISTFLADDSPDAYPEQIDRLLDSDQYGVKWGRHWLDVARYADSNGLDENLAYGQAWRYRDYVIASFNQDKPYNQFLIEQIAGDLIPNANRESKTATGFLALGAKVLAEPDRTKLQMDIIDEQLDTLGKAFLGMTFGCVRCHDHKFDPVKQTDYYALAAIFKSTATLGETKTGVIKHWYEHSFATPEEKEALKILEAEIKKKKSAASSFKSKETVRLRGVARSKAVDYLVAASQFETGLSLAEVETLAAPLELHPRILHHCRLHLDYHHDDPFFAPWHDYYQSGNHEGIRTHYAKQFSDASKAFADARKTNPNLKTLSDPKLKLAHDALWDKSGFLAVPAKPEYAFDAEALATYHKLLDEARSFESAAADETAAMGVTEEKAISPTIPIHIRGSHKNLGSPVSREFPEVMRISESRPIFPVKGSGRLELANWMADTRHPLTARIIVNRIWAWHFGEGLSRTTENFGVLGDKPSHPELLDWLAHYFMEHNWSIKTLNRLILTSKTYQQSAVHPDSKSYTRIDPENRYLWKANLRRLEAEEIRDGILATSGRLDSSLGGKTLPLRNRQFVFNHTSEDHTTYDSLRRAVYLPIVRNNLYTFFEQFDFPDPTMPTGSRHSTVIAPQALVLMNDDLVMESADAFAHQILESSSNNRERIENAWEMAYSRPPSEPEIQSASEFLEDILNRGRVDAARVNFYTEFRAWSMLCHGLFSSNEFIYLR